MGTFARIATNDATIKDIVVKQEDSIGRAFFSLSMNKEIFNDPNNSQVDRFSSENEKKHPKYQSIPF